MSAIDKKADVGSSPTRSNLSSPPLPFSIDCSPFLNWSETKRESEDEKAVVFQSLIATIKLQHTFDDTLEAKSVNVLEFVTPYDSKSADSLIRCFGRTFDESLTDFVQSIVELITSASPVITTAAMKMLDSVLGHCSAYIHLRLVKADLIPQLILTLNPQSLSFAETDDIHTGLMRIISNSLWLATRGGLAELIIEYWNEQQAVHETIFKQVLVPSEKYIWHLCVNRFSIIEGEQSDEFLTLLARIPQISPSYQPTMEVVLHMPVILTIPSCLTFFENDYTIWSFLDEMVDVQRERNKKRGNFGQMWKTVHRMLRIEGVEDLIEQKLLNDKNPSYGGDIVANSIKWNNLLGMNLPSLW
ncbi:hypothetical protein BLNAU_9100 [Blattamonas nauphoetae]|uniref:Uncharacterized protein n=1 Tax=Blattamonas nauphoetae TaxID=2049346 RepID=A0ABQ9XWV1_9EUKA|nr:hypothetical protein BLNAU_9100 [Blattamonas nauphoetae]